jgi:hypothetical protein
MTLPESKNHSTEFQFREPKKTRNTELCRRVFRCGELAEPEWELAMPVIFLWGIPALIVIGGGVYWVAHLH